MSSNKKLIGDCETGVFPLDKMFGLGPSPYPTQVQTWMVRLGSELPFRQAVKVLAELTTILVSEATIQRWTEAIGQEIVDEIDRQATQLCGHLPEPQTPPSRKVVTVDGAFVPVLGGWKFVVTGDPIEDDHHQVHLDNLCYTARITDHETMTRLCYPDFHRQSVDGALAVALVSDGADWIQSLMDAYRPEAVRILDAMPACQRLAAISTTLFADEVVAKRWYQRYRQRLLAGPTEWVLIRLQRWSRRVPLIMTDVTYLVKRKQMLHYATFSHDHWPIGSGSGESGHRHVMQRRLKGPGMHWEVSHANALLALRCVEANQQWNDELPQALERHRRACLHARRTRQQKRFLARPSPLPHTDAVLMAPLADGSSHAPSQPLLAAIFSPHHAPVSTSSHCPAAHHPWRQYRQPPHQSTSVAIK